MRVLLKPEIVRNMGIVLLRPGSENLPLFSGRVLIEPQPAKMAKLPSGRIPAARQPLAEDSALVTFFTDERVIRAAGGLPALDVWLRHHVKHCQYPHSSYHHNELVIMRYEPGSMMVCWHCDNELREQTTDFLASLARRNIVDWIIDSVLVGLGYNNERDLSLAELCWWAVSKGAADAITESMALDALRLPTEPFQSVYKESDIVPAQSATSILKNRLQHYTPPAQGGGQPLVDNHSKPLEKPIVKLTVDPESPATLMKRPKRHRWENEKYTRWVKAQPCMCCGQQADDPHHLIGHGQGGMGTKAHDSFTIPLCRVHHDELHRDMKAFERKHGTQPEMIIRLQDRAYALGVLA